jgi:hypothetical protein
VAAQGRCIDQNIVHEDQNAVMKEFVKYQIHYALKCCQGACRTKGHGKEFI